MDPATLQSFSFLNKTSDPLGLTAPRQTLVNLIVRRTVQLTTDQTHKICSLIWDSLSRLPSSVTMSDAACAIKFRVETSKVLAAFIGGQKYAPGVNVVCATYASAGVICSGPAIVVDDIANSRRVVVWLS